KPEPSSEENTRGAGGTAEALRRGDREARDRGLFPQARPEASSAEPGDVRRPRRRGPRDRASRPRRRPGPGGPFQAPDRAVAVVHAPLRQLRRGDGRGARQGAGGGVKKGTHGDRGPAPDEEGGGGRSRDGTPQGGPCHRRGGGG